MLNPTKNKSTSFAFVDFRDSRSTFLAVENFDGIDLQGQKIKVNYAREATPRDQKRVKKDYTAMITKELFSNAKIPKADMTSLEPKRRRTGEELELLKRYKLGEVNEAEYLALKKELKSKIHRDKK